MRDITVKYLDELWYNIQFNKIIVTEQYRIERGEIRIQNLQCKELIFLKNVTLNNTIVKNSERINNSTMVIENTTFKKGLNIEWGDVLIEKCNIQGWLQINRMNWTIIASDHNNNIESNFSIKVKIQFGELDTISYIENNIKHFDLEINRTKNIENISIKKPYKSVILNSIQTKENFSLDIKNSIINEGGIFHISESIINWKISLYQFYNLSNVGVLFSNSVIKNFRLHSCNLWTSALNWITIWELTLENVTLNDCIFNAIEFESYELWEIKDNDWNINYKKQKDSYRQLKHVMDKNWNHTEANKFYALEMEYYERTLDIWWGWFLDNLKNFIKTSFHWEKAKILWEIIVLRFSKRINDFWNNWLSPLFWLLFFSSFATLIDGIISTNSIKELFYPIAFFALLWGVFYIFRKFEKTRKVNDFVINISQNTYLIIFAAIFTFIGFSLKGFNFLEAFSVYVNPIWFLPEYFIQNGEKLYIKYSWFEKLIFILYKALYGVILWHLIVAAKRTTKR